MTTEWRPAIKPRQQHGATVQTIRAGISNETGHDVVIAARTLRVLPDGVTTSRKRSCIISDALAQAEALLYPGPERDDTAIALLTGYLLLNGATNLWLDGEPLTPPPAVPAGQWVVTLTGDGGVDARFLGGEG